MFWSISYQIAYLRIADTKMEEQNTQMSINYATEITELIL
jgi:hypothetical protein